MEWDNLNGDTLEEEIVDIPPPGGITPAPRAWIEPIFDRTAIDVEIARANPNSPQPLKGARNASDLNRVYNNCIILRDELRRELGIALPPLQQSNDWSMEDLPNEADIAKITADVEMLAKSFAVMRDTPATPSLPINTIEKMNAIERILHDIRILLYAYQYGVVFSGEQYSGE